MALTTGTRLGPYEVIAAIGAGGMGEVYRARDATLNRDVAIKVLPAALASDPERLARFKREAQVLASLNHPNIAHVYGFEGATLSDGSMAHFLAMELVEGDDLSERLRRGALPVDEAIVIAKQIAEGLEDAHEHGIIHRDLKPANIKVTAQGKVKILDFGLARALEGDASSAAANSQLSHSPTISRHMTEAGMILGTAAYMSPEQARGKTVDKRTDIWAFGVVLFEMLTGERLFAGETLSDTLAAVLKEEVPWAHLPGDAPRSVTQLLRRCLARDPRQRLRDIGDARIALESVPNVEDDAPSSGAAPGAARSQTRFVRLWPVTATALALAGWATAALLLRPRAAAPQPELKASLLLPESVTIPILYNGNTALATIAISPQGDKVAFVGIKEGRGGVYVRDLDRFEATLLPGPEGASAPFFSPNGKRLGFFARDRLWRLDLPDGIPVDVGPGGPAVGGSWGEDGRIVYTRNWADALWMVPEQGGEPRAFTTLNRAAGEIGHRWPCVLPNGKGVLFTVKSASDRSFDDAGIAIADPTTGAHRILMKGGSKPRYLGDGRIVFMRGARLYAVAFDLESKALRGAPAPVLDGVTSSNSTGNAWYDVSLGGDLVYLAGTSAAEQAGLSWEGPGKAAIIIGGLDGESVTSPALSSDFKRAVVRIPEANDKLGLLDMERKNLTRLTSGGGNESYGVLSKDGRFVLFSSDRAGGTYRLYRMPLEDAASPALLLEGGVVFHSISYGAGMLGLSLTSERVDADAYILPVAEDGTPRGKPILAVGGPGNQTTPAVSPDGKLVAWVSDESGRREVYAARLGDQGTRRRLTNTGGDEPRWNRQGTRLFYVTAPGIESVALRSSADVSFGDPELVTRSAGTDRLIGYDVAADGTSVVFSAVGGMRDSSRNIRLWRGWGETVKDVR